MPNHCDNTLWVVGRPAEVKKFLETSKNPDHGRGAKSDDHRAWRIFERNYPCPQELRDTKAAHYADVAEQAEQERAEQANLEKHGSRHWYDWCCDNWGTKWGDYDTHLVHQGRNGATFSFTTAWSPGSAGLRKISALYPELAFVNSYEESGCDFIGCDAFYRGETVYSGCGGLPKGPDDWEDDEANEMYYEEVGRTRDKWTGKATAKLARKSPFHGKKMRAMTLP